jgi:hypothetical protein
MRGIPLPSAHDFTQGATPVWRSSRRPLVIVSDGEPCAFVRDTSAQDHEEETKK